MKWIIGLAAVGGVAAYLVWKGRATSAVLTQQPTGPTTNTKLGSATSGTKTAPAHSLQGTYAATKLVGTTAFAGFQSAYTQIANVMGARASEQAGPGELVH